MLFRVILVWSTTVHQLRPQVGPKRTPNNFGTIRIHNSYSSVWSGIPVPSTVGPSHLPGIFIFLLFLPRLMQWYLIVAAHHSVRCFLASRVVKKKTLFLVKSRCCLFRWRACGSETVIASTVGQDVLDALLGYRYSRLALPVALGTTPSIHSPLLQNHAEDTQNPTARLSYRAFDPNCLHQRLCGRIHCRQFGPSPV